MLSLPQQLVTSTPPSSPEPPPSWPGKPCRLHPSSRNSLKSKSLQNYPKNFPKRLFNQYKDSPNSLVDSVCPSTSPRSAAALTADMDRQRRMLCAMPRFLSNLPQERGSGMALHPGWACGQSTKFIVEHRTCYTITYTYLICNTYH